MKYPWRNDSHWGKGLCQICLRQALGARCSDGGRETHAMARSAVTAGVTGVILAGRLAALVYPDRHVRLVGTVNSGVVSVVGARGRCRQLSLMA